MKLGVLIFQTDLSAPITDIARAVEDAGLESLFLVEHTHTPVSSRDVLQGRNRHDDHILDPFIALGAAAAVTSRVRLGTAVSLVAQHDPITLARQIATLDHLSGGRFLFGIGAGWVPDEMRNHGLEPRLRWRVMREKVLAMQAIWTHDEAAFHGRFVDFDPILSWPKPVQRPFPPVLVGGDGHLSLRAAATYGDGWIPGIEELAAFEEQRGEVYRLCDEAGRPPIGITVCAFDQSLMTPCSELGVERFVVAVSEAHDLAALRSFLDGYAALGTRLGATSPP